LGHALNCKRPLRLALEAGPSNNGALNSTIDRGCTNGWSDNKKSTLSKESNTEVSLALSRLSAAKLAFEVKILSSKHSVTKDRRRLV